MDRSTTLLLSPLVAVVVLMAAMPAEAEHTTYLSLGDSLAFGVGQDQSLSDISDGDRGYVSLFADYLGVVQGDRPRVINLGISGETTTSLYDGLNRNPPNPDPLRNTNYLGLDPVPTQFERFTSVVAAELAAGREISTVSVSLGSNDLYQLQANPDFQAADLATQLALLTEALGQLGARYAGLLGDIRTVLPEAQLLILGTYNPFGDTIPLVKPAIEGLNTVIAGLETPFGATYVDVYTTFLGNELAYTNIAEGNIHPTAAGYQAIAGAMITAVPEPGSLVLLGLGGAGLGIAALRRRRPAKAA